MPATHLRNHAETARMIASFGNFQVRKMPGGQSEARRGVIWYISRLRRHKIQWHRGWSLPSEHLANDFAGLGDLIDSHECAPLRNLVRELAGEPLRHATANDEFLALSLSQA